MTYGDESAMRGECREDGRRPMPWNCGIGKDAVVSGTGQPQEKSGEQWDARILEVYRGLISARNVSHALRHGGLRGVHEGDDALVLLGESSRETALVHFSAPLTPRFRCPPGT